MAISTDVEQQSSGKWIWTIYLGGFPIYHGDGHDTEYAAKEHLRQSLTALASSARNESVNL